MGMAASQVRLLALTAQMHNVELKSQHIMAQKIALATQEDAAYQEYLEALDKTKIQVAVRGDMGTIDYVDANYSTVCGYNENNMRQYSLTDNKTGKVIVPQYVKDCYEDYGNDKYTFAWAALGFCNSDFGWEGAEYCGLEIGIGNAQDIPPYANSTDDDMDLYCEELNGEMSLYFTEVEAIVFNDHYDGDTILQAKFQALKESEPGAINQSSTKERKALLEELRDYLYSKYGDEIFDLMVLDKQEDFDPDNCPILEEYSGMTWDSIQGEFKYYFNLWDQIDAAGGCETLDEEYRSGEEGTEWFNNMVSSGLVSIHMLDTTKNKGWQNTTIATSVGNNYLKEVQDEEAAKEAEVKYEHDLKVVNYKDSYYDTELKKLETQENAFKTELESIKKVKQDNIERTYNIFS